MDASLTGTWIFREERPFVQDIVLTVFPDGRLAQCFRQGASLTRVVASTMRAAEEGGLYRVKTEATASGYVISMVRDGDSLIIENKGRRTVCRRLAPTEVPDWYSEVMARALWR
jgi:hypothetical protein